MDKSKSVLVIVLVAIFALAIFMSFFGMDIIVRIGQQSLTIN